MTNAEGREYVVHHFSLTPEQFKRTPTSDPYGRDTFDIRFADGLLCGLRAYYDPTCDRLVIVHQTENMIIYFILPTEL